MTQPEIQTHTAETLASIAIAERMLDVALSPTAIDQLPERDLEALWQALQVFQRHYAAIREASSKIEEQAFEETLALLRGETA